MMIRRYATPLAFKQALELSCERSTPRTSCGSTLLVGSMFLHLD